MLKKVCPLIFASILILIAPSCKVTVSDANSKTIPLGTYQGGGGKIIFAPKDVTICDDSGSPVAKGFYKYIDGELAIRFSEIYDTEHNRHTQASDSAEIKEKFITIKDLAIESAMDSLHWVYDYGLTQYNTDYSNYEAAVGKLLSRRIENYMVLQRDIFLHAIHKKFGDFHRFKYDVDDDGNLTIKQVFSNLGSSSSYFYSGENVLNDFENDIPFMIKVGRNFYIGTPSIIGKKFQVNLINYIDINLPLQDIVDFYEELIGDTLWDNESDVVAEASYYEICLKRHPKAPDIPTAKKILDTALPREKLEGKISVGKTTPTLTISNMHCKNPELSGETLTFGSFKPILSFDGQILSKVDN